MSKYFSSTMGVLVMASQRKLRKALFNALYREGNLLVYLAKNPAHASVLLEGSHPLSLLVVSLDGSQKAQDQCEQLRHIPACINASLIVVLVDDVSIRTLKLPVDVGDWLYASQISSELASRWHGIRHMTLTHRNPGLIPEDKDDYRFIFEDNSSEWIIIDPVIGQVLEVSPAWLRHSGLSHDEVLSHLPNELLMPDGMDLEQLLGENNHQWHPGGRYSNRGIESGELIARQGRYAGRDVVAMAFRSHCVGVRPDLALNLLARFFAISPDKNDMEIMAQLLMDELGLDYLAVWAGQINNSDDPVQLMQHWRGEACNWSAMPFQGCLRLVLNGRTLLYTLDAQRLATADPLIADLDLNGFVGLPLLDERNKVLGAFLAGRQQPFAMPKIIEPVMLCVANYFAHMLELRRARAQGRIEGLIDALTGLPNRLMLNDQLDNIIHEASRTGESFAVLFADLDQFKLINDNMGHAVGDYVLVAVTQRLCSSVRSSDIVARYAGDEFVLVLRHITRHYVLTVVEKIVQKMASSLQLEDGTKLQVTFSIGISFFAEHATDTETLINQADKAMYVVKKKGGGSYQIYHMDSIQEEQSVLLMRDLWYAESKGQLRIFYQLQANIANQDIVGMEALVRWEHPELGTISPDRFIPITEKNGLIISISEWVLRTTCRQAYIWDLRYKLNLRLSVNLSVIHLMQPNLINTVRQVLEETGLSPEQLELEVTESIHINNEHVLLNNLHELRGIGCSIAIDDFGTGSGSLEYLRKLPADRIKIAPSFVCNIGIKPKDEIIICSIIDTAHRLRLKVIAEGVELKEHLDFLRQNQCDEFQGHLFCRPLSHSDLDNLLANRVSFRTLPDD